MTIGQWALAIIAALFAVEIIAAFVMWDRTLEPLPNLPKKR